MSEIQTHKNCDKCGHKECLTIFPDGSKYCHSGCGLYDKPKTRAKQDNDPELELELAWDHEAYRAIKLDTAQRLNILTGRDKDGAEVGRMYPYPHRPKLRILPKDFSKNRGFTNDHLIGMDRILAGSSKALTIVEGEDDWAAADQILNEKGGWPVVGIPGAALSKALLTNKPACARGLTVKEWIDTFDTIVIATDADDAGEAAANKLASIFPGKCYRVKMSKYKDVMEYSEAGKGKEWFHTWLNRQKYVPPFDTSTPNQFINLFHESKDQVYVPTGIEAYDDLALGLFQGEFTVFTAPEGVGKTELMRYFEYMLIRDHPGLPFAFCHLEESQQRSLLGLVSYHLGKNVTRKDLVENQEEVEKAISEITSGENVHLFRVGVDEDSMVLVDRIKYYANVCDCKYVFIEPIQDIMHQRQDSSNTVEFLDKLAVNLSRTAAETGCGIITIAHMNETGNIRDSRMLQKQAAVRVDLERNIESTDEETRNTTTLTVRKNRPVGPTGFAGEMVFDPYSFTLSEKSY